MAMYRSATGYYYEVNNVDEVSASIREVSGDYAPLDDHSVGMRRFRVRVSSRVALTGDMIESAIEKQRQRRRDREMAYG